MSHLARNHYVLVSRVALFIVYFWFGILKVVGLSPASPMIEQLYHVMPNLMSFPTFIVVFGIIECLIGVLCLIKGLENITVPVVLIHVIIACLPLIVLPGLAWSAFWVPSLEGQYIIKNVLIIAAVITIAGNAKVKYK